MAYKRYNLKDNAFAILGNGISASTTTINIVDPSGFSWVKEFPDDNFVGTLVQYGIDGNPSKVEKVYVSVRSGDVLTVQRGYLGDAPQTFAKDDYIFLNVVADHIDDVHRRIDEVDDTIDDIYAEGTRRLRVYRLPGDPPLQVRIGAGTYRVGSAEGQYNGGTLVVEDDETTYIMIDSGGAIQSSTSGWNGQYARLGVVVSLGGLITSIRGWRNDTIGGEIGVDGFQNITSTTYTKGLLTAFTADAVNYTVTYERKRRPKTISNGTNTWTISYSKGFVSGTIKT